MILAAHQPSYLPWLGYLDKMARADVFVVMDDLQYEAQNFQNRNRVKLADGPAWLTVPLERGAQTDRICDKQIQNGGSPKEHWARRTWKTLEIHYGRAPHFARYRDELADLFARRWERLVELDLHILEMERRWLGIEVPMMASSTLGLTGQKTDRIIDMCQKVGADVYLSGGGGSRDYLDVERMRAAGIEVQWQCFAHPVYPQRYAGFGFVPNLAFLDLLLNCGLSSRDVLLHGRAAA
jgi:hypothetical protein